MTKRSIYWDDLIAENVIRIVAFISLLFIFLIFIFVFRESRSIFFHKELVYSADTHGEMETYGDTEDMMEDLQISERSREGGFGEEKVTAKNLLGRQWQPVSDKPKYGLWPLFAGSFKVTFIALLFAGPLGILAALFSTAFAPKWARELLKPCIEILAGIPSVVIGFFALMVLASFLQSIFGYHYRLNAFVGGVALSLAVVPIVFTVAEDALNAVPRTLTEGSLALGASRWQTVAFIVLPAATPGVLAATLLGFGRAFGETMIVLMATGNAALLSFNPVEPVRTMSATIGAEMAEVVFGDAHYGVLFLIGSLLFVFTFTLNAIAEFYIRQRLVKKIMGG